ncbi:MAG TPA: hypothetical protein PKD53_00455 [Chloroflexaceae bacterium]|nr:hypothetical protein [Chloroflexaceae bacterium]
MIYINDDDRAEDVRRSLVEPWASTAGALPAELLRRPHPLLPAVDDLIARYQALLDAGCISDPAKAAAFAESLIALRRRLAPCSLCRGAGCDTLCGRA